jgi:beta-lactamase superfamily II metal-dependent hydrolase
MNAKHLITLSFIIVALIALGSTNALATPEEWIELSFINVGQGDSALISDMEQ